MPVVVSAGASGAIAAAVASNAAAAATRAHGQRCEETIHGYDSRAATISEMQEYSECVEYIHPKQSDMPQGVAVIILVFVLSGASIGAFNGDDFADMFVMGILGAICGFLALVVGAGLILLVAKAIGF